MEILVKKVVFFYFLKCGFDKLKIFLFGYFVYYVYKIFKLIIVYEIMLLK